MPDPIAVRPRSAPSAADRAGAGRLATLGLVAVPYAWLVHRFDFVCDDAYISFRYARNLAEGSGLRYNLVGPPVEGYSELLWVLWSALFEWLGVDVTMAARATSVLCGVALLWWVMRFAERRLDLSPGRAALPAAFLATFPPFAVWSTGGLATVPFAFTLFASHDALLRDPARPRWIAAAAFGVLAALLRADGALFVGVVLAVAALSAVARRDFASGRAAVLAGAVVAVAVAAQLAFRLSYYGAWVPNTALAKVTFSSFALEQGRNYLLVMGFTFPAFVLIPAAAIGAMIAARRWSGETLELLAVPFAVALYVGLVSGGDWMPMARMLLQSLPFLAVLLALPLRDLERRSPALRFAALAWPLLLIALSLPTAFDHHPVPASLRYAWRIRPPIAMSEYRFWQIERDRTRSWVVLGKELARRARPGDALAQGPIGAVGYFSRLHIHDMFGLVDREVALRPVSDAELRDPWRPPGHHKVVPREFFLPRQPRWLEVSFVTNRRTPPEIPGYRTTFEELPPLEALGNNRLLRVIERVDP
jgi:hypothetical protein